MLFNETTRALLQILNRGGAYSGQALANEIGITRNAIWKQIESLKKNGIPILSNRQTGYQLLTPLIPLDIDDIKAELGKTANNTDINWHLFLDIPSTNGFLKSRTVERDTWDICLAEQQLKGRGRFNRDWHSPFAQNIYCSISWMYSGDSSDLSGLSLVVGLCILEALLSYGISSHELMIKWPNDIYIKDKKLAGVLIELSAESHYQTQVIVGIGLNVNMSEANIDKNWTSLCLEDGQTHNRNRLTSALLSNLLYQLSDYTKEKKNTLLKSWQTYDYLYNQSVSIQRHGNPIAGIAKGINENGDLILLLPSGETITCSSGEVSVKREK